MQKGTSTTLSPFVGILKPTGTPNDRALFVNMEGFFLLEGHAKEEGGRPKASAKQADHEHDQDKLPPTERNRKDAKDEEAGAPITTTQRGTRPTMTTNMTMPTSITQAAAGESARSNRHPGQDR